MFVRGKREKGKRRKMNWRTGNEVAPPPSDKTRYEELDKIFILKQLLICGKSLAVQVDQEVCAACNVNDGASELSLC